MDDTKKTKTKKRTGPGRPKKAIPVVQMPATVPQTVRDAVLKIIEISGETQSHFITNALTAAIHNIKNTNVDLEGKIVIPISTYAQFTGYTSTAIASKVRNGKLEQSEINGKAVILIPSTDKLSTLFKVALIEEQQKLYKKLTLEIVQDNFLLKSNNASLTETIETLTKRIENLEENAGINNELEHHDLSSNTGAVNRHTEKK